MGPPPKAPGTQRGHRRQVGMTMLPASGRQGAAPVWPLPDDVAKQVLVARLDERVEELQEQLRDCPSRSRAKLERQLEASLTQSAVLSAELDLQRGFESALWDELWGTPQAAQWEALGWHRDVAQYVRHKVRAEMGSLDDAKEARQWSDRLGLNPLAMLRLRWETERVEAAEAEGRSRRSAAAPAKKTTRGRTAADPRSVFRVV